MPINHSPPPASPALAPAPSEIEPEPIAPSNAESASAILTSQSSNRIPARSLSTIKDSLRLPANRNLLSFGSDPNLSDQNLNGAKRRRLDGDDDVLNAFMAEIRQMFLTFRAEQEKQYDKLFSTVEDIRSTVDFMAEKCETLQTRLEQLEAARLGDIQYTRSLEDRIDNLERNARSTCLEVRNVPPLATENKLTLLNTFLETTKVLKVPLQQNDIKDIFRISTKSKLNKTIIVELASVIQKDRVISMFRQYNKHPSRLTTEHLHLKGPVVPIYISENLTSKMKKLFYLAREFAKQNDYKFCWVSHGKIFLRKRENGPLVRVASEADLVVPM